MTDTLKTSSETVGRLRIERSEMGDGRPTVMIYRGTGRNPISNYYFRTDEAREAHVTKMIARDVAWFQTIEDRKAERAAIKASVKVGTIFGTSWGYDQTNREWYQVISIKGATVTLRQLMQQSDPEREEGFSSMSDHVRCIPGSFFGEAFTRRLTSYGIKINSSVHGRIELDCEEYRYVSSYA